MVWITFFVLFFITMLGGLSIYVLDVKRDVFGLPLIFAGSFLFSVTIIHIIPELFHVATNPHEIGLYILGGFFFQQLLETFTSGVEHGHYHQKNGRYGASRYGLMVALVIHSLLEGSLLTHESPFHEQHESYSLLFGIAFHKVPAAFALMAMIRSDRKLVIADFLLLVIFSIASPMGMLLSSTTITFSEEQLLLIFAVVSGSFLHISTTIFVETSPHHKLGLRKAAISLLGALMAIFIEYFF